MAYFYKNDLMQTEYIVDENDKVLYAVVPVKAWEEMKNSLKQAGTWEAFAHLEKANDAAKRSKKVSGAAKEKI